MIINASTLNELNRDLKLEFTSQLQKTVPVMNQMVNQIPVKSQLIADISVAALPGLRLWKGKKNYNPIELMSTTKYTSPFQLSVEASKWDLMSDRVGAIQSAVRQMGQQTVRHINKQASLALLNGTTTVAQYLGYDSKAIFATNHILDGATSQSNLLTASLDATGLATALGTAKSWVNNYNEPMYVGFDEVPFLVVPTQLETTARNLVEAERNSSGADNTLKGRAIVVVNPYLDVEPTNWYLIFNNMGEGAISHFELQAPTFVPQIDPTAQRVFEYAMYSWSVEANSHTCIINWFNAIKSAPGGSLYTGTTVKE